MPSRSFAVKFGIAASAALLVASAVSANAAEKTLIDKGEVLVRENCSRCHAIGKEGDSPHKEAPPFRTLAKNIRSRASPNRSPKASSRGTPTCRSSCSARTTSRRSSNICRAFRRNSSAPFLGLDGKRYGVRPPRPDHELVGVVEEAFHNLPIGQGDTPRPFGR